MQSEAERWDYLVALDDELLIGGATESEWAALMVREADTAFARGAHLASILTAVAAIETHLRAEYGERRSKLHELIEAAAITDELRAALHRLRQVRNRWVHVDSSVDDTDVIEHPERYEAELAREAASAARVLREVLYHDQWL